MTLLLSCSGPPAEEPAPGPIGFALGCDETSAGPRLDAHVDTSGVALSDVELADSAQGGAWRSALGSADDGFTWDAELTPPAGYATCVELTHPLFYYRLHREGSEELKVIPVCAGTTRLEYPCDGAADSADTGV